ncbi:MAG: hypothetical protein IH830_11750 [Planctomycetes bacterium]|nr:hypothetical protein [Planctomycetota bacterium]
MAKVIFFVHGRSFKPPKAKLKRLWFDAVEAGLDRDFPPSRLAAFKRVKKEFVYYGKISNTFLKKAANKPANFNTDDSASRHITLKQLKAYAADQFTERTYNKLPGKSAAGEALADLFGGVAAFFHVSDPLIEAIAPDMREYWNFESQFGSDVRETLSTPLARALRNGHKVLLLSHSLGTMIAYDTLWKFSYYSEYKDIRNKKVDLLVTLGSPLGDETVKRNLKGAKAPGSRRYPTNIRRWVNVAAEDDYVAHDEKVRNDFKGMLKHDLVESIRDHRIYNLAVRHGKSNPHHGAGYLINPKVTELIANWI